MNESHLLPELREPRYKITADAGTLLCRKCSTRATAVLIQTAEREEHDRWHEATERPARCYVEFCCNTATVEVELLDRSFRQVGDTRPRTNPIPWGWCQQHKSNARGL